MRLDLFVKLEYESSTITLFPVIRYSMRDLLSVPNCLTRKLAICVTYTVNDVSASSGSSSP